MSLFSSFTTLLAESSAVVETLSFGVGALVAVVQGRSTFKNFSAKMAVRSLVRRNVHLQVVLIACAEDHFVDSHERERIGGILEAAIEEETNAGKIERRVALGIARVAHGMQGSIGNRFYLELASDAKSLQDATLEEKERSRDN